MRVYLERIATLVVPQTLLGKGSLRHINLRAQGAQPSPRVRLFPGARLSRAARLFPGGQPFRVARSSRHVQPSQDARRPQPVQFSPGARVFRLVPMRLGNLVFQAALRLPESRARGSRPYRVPAPAETFYRPGGNAWWGRFPPSAACRDYVPGRIEPRSRGHGTGRRR